MSRICKFILLIIVMGLGWPGIHAQEENALYWEGAGDTPSMEDYAFEGHYLRFTEFPVGVYINPGAGEIWQAALADAIEQVSEVVPLQATANAAEAQIIIRVVGTTYFERLTPCDGIHQDGCSQMIPLGQPGTSGFSLHSRVWIRRDTRLPVENVLLHELIHALGLLVHSPDPGDVMYNGTEAPVTRLSARDVATLVYLYEQPALENGTEE
jgi:predicted Zn-dependent protease